MGGKSPIILENVFILGKTLLSQLVVACAYWKDDSIVLSLKKNIIAH